MKKTKFLFGMFIAVMTFGWAFTACEHGTGGGSSGGGGDLAIVGKWYATQSAADSEDESLLAFEFTSDGKMLLGSRDEGATYTISGNNITIRERNIETRTVTCGIKGTALTLMFDGAQVFTYYKKS
ncbi:MAG: hypothetical protein LBH18_06210 [Spirochaetaceae bacterium]|nr:hypothetical protein [Spirochaetaceae bacterium]